MIVRGCIATMIVALSGCATAPSYHAQASDPFAWVNYTCSDGQTVEAAYPDSQTAVISIHHATHTLHSVISGSGARYAGDGWQWWTKGMREGMLAPLAPGETIASAPGIDCHAG
ncbi:hypothetical protein DWU98_08095 [Dyella monticola]|uniref:C-type lysozyme inhibitor domain-containing protein n=1 Tax=Dyella monticola TaxID=1927958 RepID=A0A370X3U0_9GAMM|nr:MliC family protein [Dyella monticola]RDS83079.1 hypothetical protein DWU98_08095 [Dyella monticola]